MKRNYFRTHDSTHYKIKVLSGLCNRRAITETVCVYYVYLETCAYEYPGVTFNILKAIPMRDAFYKCFFPHGNGEYAFILKAAFHPETVMEVWAGPPTWAIKINSSAAHSAVSSNYACSISTRILVNMSRFKRGGKVDSMADLKTDKAEPGVPSGLLNAARKSGQLNLTGRGLTEGNRRKRVCCIVK